MKLISWQIRMRHLSLWYVLCWRRKKLKSHPKGRCSDFNYGQHIHGSCFAFIHSNRNNLYRKQRLYSRLVKYNTLFVRPKSIMVFLLSKLRFEILGFHNSYDVYRGQVHLTFKCVLIECNRRLWCLEYENGCLENTHFVHSNQHNAYTP